MAVAATVVGARWGHFCFGKRGTFLLGVNKPAGVPKTNPLLWHHAIGGGAAAVAVGGAGAVIAFTPCCIGPAVRLGDQPKQARSAS